MGNEISRRTVAKGVAWVSPVVLASGAAPAFAASGVVVTSSLTYGVYCPQLAEGTTASFALNIDSATGTVPAGTAIAWSVCVADPTVQAWGAPAVNYVNINPDNSADWSVQTSHSFAAALTGGDCYTITFTANTDVAVPAAPAVELTWPSADAMLPNETPIVFSNTVSGPSVVDSAGSVTLKVNFATRTMTGYDLAGAQAALPLVNNCGGSSSQNY